MFHFGWRKTWNWISFPMLFILNILYAYCSEVVILNINSLASEHIIYLLKIFLNYSTRWYVFASPLKTYSCFLCSNSLCFLVPNDSWITSFKKLHLSNSLAYQPSYSCLFLKKVLTCLVVEVMVKTIFSHENFGFLQLIYRL